MATSESQRCRHADCACAGGESGFCGAYCANAAASDALPATCACGHAACVADPEPERSHDAPPISVGPPGRRGGGEPGR